MKRLTLIAGLLLTMVWSAGALAAHIGVVDMQKIFHGSPQVKNMSANLTKQFAGRKNKIMNIGKALQANLKKYQKNKAVMSGKNLASLKASITKQELQLRTAQAKFQQDLFAAQNKKMSQFMKQVRTAVKKIATKKKLDMVLPKNSVLYSAGALDITSNVIASLG